jgi:hypothetical protein
MNHAKIGVINGTAILIAQYWGEYYHHQHQRTSHYKLYSNTLIYCALSGKRYYHWMSECFPRLALIKDYLDAHPSAKILFFRGGDTKQTILKMIGVDPDRIIDYKGFQLTFVEHLIVPTATAEGRIIQ